VLGQFCAGAIPLGQFLWGNSTGAIPWWGNSVWGNSVLGQFRVGQSRGGISAGAIPWRGNTMVTMFRACYMFYYESLPTLIYVLLSVPVLVLDTSSFGPANPRRNIPTSFAMTEAVNVFKLLEHFQYQERRIKEKKKKLRATLQQIEIENRNVEEVFNQILFSRVLVYLTKLVP
jgi:hypothetical protein